MISTHNFSALPDIDNLLRLYQSLAMMDALLEPEWGSRYYSFNAAWGANQQLASMHNGSGDEYYIVFGEAGAVIKGFAHESPLARSLVETETVWPGVLDRVPPDLLAYVSDLALEIEVTTFCLWRKTTESVWSVGDIAFPPGPDPDGSEDLLYILDGNPQTYQTWAEEYYEREVSLDLVRYIYEHKPLDTKMLSRFQLSDPYDTLFADAAEIGYPFQKE